MQRKDLPKAFKDGFQVDSEHLTQGLFNVARKTETLIQALTQLQKENVAAQKTIDSMGFATADLARERQKMEQYRIEITKEIDEVTRALHEQIIKNRELQGSLAAAESKMDNDAATILVSEAITHEATTQ